MCLSALLLKKEHTRPERIDRDREWANEQAKTIERKRANIQIDDGNGDDDDDDDDGNVYALMLEIEWKMYYIYNVYI